MIWLILRLAVESFASILTRKRFDVSESNTKTSFWPGLFKVSITAFPFRMSTLIVSVPETNSFLTVDAESDFGGIESPFAKSRRDDFSESLYVPMSNSWGFAMGVSGGFLQDTAQTKIKKQNTCGNFIVRIFP